SALVNDTALVRRPNSVHICHRTAPSRPLRGRPPQIRSRLGQRQSLPRQFRGPTLLEADTVLLVSSPSDLNRIVPRLSAQPELLCLLLLLCELLLQTRPH